MTLPELISRIVCFDESSHYEKIRLFAWHLHTHQNIETFGTGSIRDCYRAVHAVPPNLSVYLPRMAAKKPAELLRSRTGFQLAGSVRRSLDEKYGKSSTVIAVTRLLSDLPSQVANVAEKVFLSETIDCYSVGAFRAAIVMAWNLAFDHLTGWILLDAGRLAAFNAALASKYPKKATLRIGQQDDFVELKESETIEICRTAKILTKNTVTILNEKLRRRNMAAHPSNIIFIQSQADDVITDLVNNVVLLLK